jgi:hypothetical protein
MKTIRFLNLHRKWEKMVKFCKLQQPSTTHAACSICRPPSRQMPSMRPWAPLRPLTRDPSGSGTPPPFSMPADNRAGVCPLWQAGDVCKTSTKWVLGLKWAGPPIANLTSRSLCAKCSVALRDYGESSASGIWTYGLVTMTQPITGWKRKKKHQMPRCTSS